MKQSNSYIACLALSIALFTGCNNSVSPTSEPFFIRLAKADSTGHYNRRIIPYSDAYVFQQTLHYNDTAGAVVSFQNDTEDVVIITPAGTYSYQNHNIDIDSTDCDQNGCKYWVNGIQVDTIFLWDIGFICSFMGHPAIIVKSNTSSTVAIGYPNDTVTITYRDSITTAAGTTRNNLLSITRGVAMQSINVRTLAMPTGITVTPVACVLPTFHGDYNLGQWYSKTEISSSVAPGEYTFEFSIKIDGKEYGNIPRTIQVIQ